MCFVFGTFLAGVVLAIGHDRFHSHLSGQRIDGFILAQNWVSRVSTAFAFLVKMCLTATAATSYFQRLWRNLKTPSFEVKKVDTLVAAPTETLSKSVAAGPRAADYGAGDMVRRPERALKNRILRQLTIGFL